MTEATLLKELDLAYKDIEKAVSKANSLRVRYGVFLSRKEYSAGKGKKIKNIKSYFKKLRKECEK